METSILKEIEWRVMPQLSITGLLFMTGLLQGLPQKCLDTLCVTILSSYKHQLINEDCQPEDAKPNDFAVFYQIRSFNPITLALACYHCMLNNSTTEKHK